MLLYQDCEATPVSEVMGEENHISAVVPKVELEAELSWPVCASTADRQALLLLELRRGRSVVVLNRN